MNAHVVAKRALAAAVLLSALPGPSSLPAAAPGALSSAFRVDWAGRALELKVTVDARAPEFQPPSGRARMEAMVDRELAAVAKDFVFRVPVDSYRTVEATVVDGTIDVNDLLELLDGRKLVDAAYSRDLSSFTVTYAFDLTRLADLYVRHRVPSVPALLMDYAPSKPYTGVVIHAKGSLPVHGEFAKDRLRPCLFPRVWDAQMNLLLERNFVSPAAISRWGAVAYADSFDPVALEARVGDEPLKLLALEIFGTQRTDVIITRDDALRLLSRPENLRLIQEGRFVIVCDLP